MRIAKRKRFWLTAGQQAALKRALPGCRIQQLAKEALADLRSWADEHGEPETVTEDNLYAECMALVLAARGPKSAAAKWRPALAKMHKQWQSLKLR